MSEPQTPQPNSAPEGHGPDPVEEHPEKAVAGAFVGGMLLALLLKRRGRR